MCRNSHFLIGGHLGGVGNHTEKTATFCIFTVTLVLNTKKLVRADLEVRAPTRTYIGMCTSMVLTLLERTRTYIDLVSTPS